MHRPWVQVGTELVRGIGHRAVLVGVPHPEIEEVDDADTHVAGDPGLLPRAGVGQLHFVADDGARSRPLPRAAAG